MKNHCRVALLVSFVLVSGAMQDLCARTAHATDRDGLYDANGHSTRNTSARPPTVPQRHAAAGVTAGADAWTSLGPDGGDVTDVIVSPVDAAIALAGIAPSASGSIGFFDPHSGVYRSTDSGAHWIPVPDFEAIWVNGLAFASDGTAYVATGDHGLWKSTDAGVHWQQLDLGIGPIVRMRSITVDPHDDATLWACLVSNGPGTTSVMRSADAGATWADRTPADQGEQRDCDAIAIEADGARRMTVVVNDWNFIGHVWRSDDGGAHWFEITDGLPPYRFHALAFAGARILVGGGDGFGDDDVGIYGSDDSGKHWHAISDANWPQLAVSAIAVAPNDPQAIVAATLGRGINRSSDGGATWQVEVGGTTNVSTNAVRFAPGDTGRVLVGAMSFGVLDSGDAGTSFAPSSAGLRELVVRSIAANPLDPDEIAFTFVAINSGGVYASVDHGAHWQLQELPPARYSRVAYSPTGVLHAIFAGPTSATQQEGLYRRNGDGSWTNLGPNVGPYFESRLEAVLFSATDPGLILLGGRDFGVAGSAGTVWRSTDAGTHWTKVHLGADFDTVTDFERVAGGDGQTLVASHDGQMPPQVGGALRSTDDGATWVDANDGLTEMAALPHLCQTPGAAPAIYLSAMTSNFDSGIFRSDDGGASWTQTAGILGVLLDVACDPFDPAVIYTAVNATSQPVLRSTDGGANFDIWSDGITNYASVNQLVASAYAGATQLLLATSTNAFVVQGSDVVFANGFEGP